MKMKTCRSGGQKLPRCFGLLALILGAGLFIGCPDSGDKPKVTGVTVSPPAASVSKGAKKQFSAAVNGENNPSQEVTWSVEGSGGGTTVSESGLLSVAADETADTLTVKATSKEDTSKSGTAAITVTSARPPEPPIEPPAVTGVTVYPGAANVSKSRTRGFYAVVTGEHNPSKDVTWSVTGGVAGTSISESGVLQVAAGETASTLSITAVSVQDSAKSGAATVTVIGVPTVTVVNITPGPNTDAPVGGNRQFFASVTGTNEPAQSVIWSVSGNDVSISRSGLLTVESWASAGGSVTVKAAAVDDPTKTATVTVWLTQVIVTPSDVWLIPGSTQTFTASLTGGTGTENFGWGWLGNNSSNTYMSNNTLYIGNDETSSFLEVRAYFLADQYGTAYVYMQKNANVTITTPFSVESGLILDINTDDPYNRIFYIVNNSSLTITDTVWYIGNLRLYADGYQALTESELNYYYNYSNGSSFESNKVYYGLVVVYIDGVPYSCDFNFKAN